MLQGNRPHSSQLEASPASSLRTCCSNLLAHASDQTVTVRRRLVSFFPLHVSSPLTLSAYSGITGSGKTFSLRLLVDQVLRLSSHSKKELRMANQIKALHTLLDAFGNAKTVSNPSASRHSRYLELHFNDRGRIESAKLLAFALDKSRLSRLAYEERTFHIFYQFLAGAAPQERDYFNIGDPSEYALLASSGCYRLPNGPFSDDAIAMEEVRLAMRTLGFSFINLHHPRCHPLIEQCPVHRG